MKTLSPGTQSGLETAKESSKLASKNGLIIRKILVHMFTKEKRTELRFPVVLSSSCLELSSAQTLNAQTHDISQGGLCLATDREIPLGIQIEIVLKMMDNNEMIHRKGTVIWSASYGDNAHRIGIKLEEPKLKPVPLVLRTIMALTQAHQKQKSE